MPYIQLPNKKYLEVPAGLTDDQAIEFAQKKVPFLYPELDQGIVERAGRALRRGIGQPVESASGIALGARAALGDMTGAQRGIDEFKKSQEAESKEPQGLSIAGMYDQYKSQGLLPALSNVPAYVTEQVLQNAPSMALPFAAAKAGAAFAGPLGGLAAGIGTYGVQQYGQFMNTQAGTEGRTAATLEPIKALGTAAVSAPFGYFFDRFVLGLSKVPAKTAVNLINKEIAARGVGQTLARGAARGLLEVPTEVLEQVAERWQAGQSLTDKDAVASYIEAAGGALALGTTAGAGFAYKQRGEAQQQVTEQEQLDKSKERNQARIDTLKTTRDAEAARLQDPAYKAKLFNERIPLVQRLAELKATLKAGGKTLDPADKKEIEAEIKAHEKRIGEIRTELQNIGAEVPAAPGTKSRAQIEAELRAKQEFVDEEGNVVRTPQQVQAEREAGVEDYYAKQDAAAKVFADKERAQKQKEEDAVTEAEYAALYGRPRKVKGEYVPQKPYQREETTFEKAQREYQEQGEAIRANRVAEAKAAAEKEAKERGLITDDYGNIVSGKEAVQLGLDTTAVKGASQTDLTPDTLRKPIDVGYVSPEVQKHLGLNLPERTEEQIPAQGELASALGQGAPEAFKGYNLNQFDQAQQVLPEIKRRIAELSRESLDVAQQGEHVVDGKITPSGQKLLDIEGRIKDLKRLERIATDAPVKEEDYRSINKQLETLSAQRKDKITRGILEPIEKLRSGETKVPGEGKQPTITARGPLLAFAQKNAGELADMAVQEANMFRYVGGIAPMTATEETSLRGRLKVATDKLLKSNVAPIEKNKQMAARVQRLLDKYTGKLDIAPLQIAKSLFEQNRATNKLTNATEQVLKKGITPNTLRVLNNITQGVAAATKGQTNFDAAIKNVDAQIEAARNRGAATDSPEMQDLFRRAVALEKQRKKGIVSSRGVAESEQSSFVTTVENIIASASAKPVGKKQVTAKGLLEVFPNRPAVSPEEKKALAENDRKRAELLSKEKRGENEPTLGAGKELAEVQKRIRAMIALGAKRSEVNKLQQLLSAKFKITTPKELDNYEERLLDLAKLEKEIMSRGVGAGELNRLRTYTIGVIDQALSRKDVRPEARKALEDAKAQFEEGKGARGTTVSKTGEVTFKPEPRVLFKQLGTNNKITSDRQVTGTPQQIKYDTTVEGSLTAALDLANDLLAGRVGDVRAVKEAIGREKDVLQDNVDQLELFAEPGREVKAEKLFPGITTGTKRTTPEKFRGFIASLKEKTNAQIDAAITVNNSSKTIRQLTSRLTELKKEIASVWEDALAEAKASPAVDAARTAALADVWQKFSESGFLETDTVFQKALDAAVEPLVIDIARKGASLAYTEATNGIAKIQAKLDTAQDAIASEIKAAPGFKDKIAKQLKSLETISDALTSKRLVLEEAQRRSAAVEARTEETEKVAQAKRSLKEKGEVLTVSPQGDTAQSIADMDDRIANARVELQKDKDYRGNTENIRADKRRIGLVMELNALITERRNLKAFKKKQLKEGINVERKVTTVSSFTQGEDIADSAIEEKKQELRTAIAEREALKEDLRHATNKEDKKRFVGEITELGFKIRALADETSGTHIRELKENKASRITNAIKTLSRTFRVLTREIRAIEIGGSKGAANALISTRASFGESGINENSQAFRKAHLEALRKAAKAKRVLLSKDDKKRLGALKRRRTKLQNDLATNVNIAAELGIKLDARASFEELNASLKDIEAQMKTAPLEEQGKLGEERSELEGVINAYTDAIRVGRATAQRQPVGKKLTELEAFNVAEQADLLKARDDARVAGEKVAALTVQAPLKGETTEEAYERGYVYGENKSMERAGYGNTLDESRGEVTDPSDKKTVLKELSRAFKGKDVTDRIVVYETVAEARAANPDYADVMHQNTRGFTVQGEVSLIAENINKGEALAVLLHELGVHVGFRNFFNPQEFNALVKVVKNWAGRKDGSIESRVGAAAMARVKEAQTNKAQFDDELLAYAVEEAVAAGLDPAGLKSGSPLRNWFNRLVQAFKSALNKLGLAPETLTAQNLVDFAYGTANMEMGRGGYHGTDKSFTAFDLRKAGTGEASTTSKYLATSIGAGPYVGIGGKDRYGYVKSDLARRTAGYYSYMVPFMKELNKFQWGDTTYAQITKIIDARTESTPFIKLTELTPSERALSYKQSILGNYAQDVFKGGEVNPLKNKAVLADLERIKKRSEYFKLSEIKLDLAGIKPYTGPPLQQKLYATLDAIPDKQIYDLNSNIKPGENPKEDALVKEYGSAEDRRLFKYDAKTVAAGGKSYGVGFPRNILFFDLVRVFGPDDAALMLKEAGYRAIQRKTDQGRMRERAYIEEAPEILTEMSGEAMGEAAEILFSRASKPMPAGFESIQDFSDAAIAQPQSFYGSMKGVKNKSLAAKVSFVDRLAAVEEVAEQAMREGKSNEALQMMYFLQKQLDLLSMASASAFNGAIGLVEDAPGEFRVQSIEGASLRSVDKALKPLLQQGFNAEQANKLFTAYMLTLRGEHEGYNKLNFNPEVIQMAREVIPAINSNKVVKDILNEARTQYNEYNRGMVDFAEKTGAITPEAAKEMRDKGDYIPYYRDVGGILTLYIGSGHPIKLGDLKNQPHLQRLVGGEEKIMDYFNSSMQNTLILTDLSLRNLAVKNTAHTFNTLGLLETSTGKDGKEHAIRNGDGPANANVLRFRDKGVDKHVVVRTEGTAYEHIPTELLVKGMEGTSIVMPKMVEMLAIPAQVLRRGITLNPLYPYYQLVKDSMAMGATKGVSYSNAANAIKGIKQYVSGDKLIKELQAKGVISEREMFTGTVSDIARVRNRVLEGEGTLHKFIAGQEARAVRADGAVRAMLYSQYIKDGLNARDAEYMAIKAMPYSRRGLDAGMRYLSHMIPFFNAQVVGLYSMYQSLLGKGPLSAKLNIKKKLYTAGMSMAVSTLAYTSLVAGSDWYENMPIETRLRNWLIKLPGMKEPLAIPIPFEFGIIFKAFFEATYLGMFKSTPEGKKVREAFNSLIFSSIPGGTISVGDNVRVPFPVPTIGLPILELAVNKSLNTGNPIENERELGVIPSERFRDTTSETAKSIGRMSGTSPLAIDHLIRGYTGTVGPAVISLVDALTGPAIQGAGVKSETMPSKFPLLGQLFKPADGGALIDLAVDALKTADVARKTYEKMAAEPGRQKEAEAYRIKNDEVIQRGAMAGKLRERLGMYAKEERAIRADDKMSPREKRLQLESLKRDKIEESKGYMQAFRSGA